MTATAARIGFSLQEYRLATAEDTAIAEQYGNLARSNDKPVPTYLDDTDDAQTIADERLELQGQPRRNFDVTVRGLEDIMKLRRGASARYVDRQRDVDRPMLISEVELDFSDQTATLNLWG